MSADTAISCNKRHMLAKIAFTLHVINCIIHIILTNTSDNAYNVTKVLLMPLLCLFFVLSVKNLQRGVAIAWGLCGLWLGNICLIWGGESNILFILGSGFTVIGLFGYIWALLRDHKTISPLLIFLQIPIIWVCVFSVFFMKDDLNQMFLPISAYMTLVAVISMLALAQALNNIRSTGAWLMFLGTLFYIAENFFYTADHYMADYSFGVNIIHPCFIMAQTLIACGYLLRERETAVNH